jgi:hypothetical protein
MFEARNSTTGEHKYLIEVDRTQQRGEEHRYAASIAQIVDCLSGDRITHHPQLHWHYGHTPEEAIDKAFAEAEGAWQHRSRIARLVQQARLVFDSQTAPATMGLRAAGHRLRKLVYATDNYLVDVQVQAVAARGDALMLGQIASAQHPAPHVDGARVLLERDAREIARTVTNRLGEFELEFSGPISDLSLTFALPHGHVRVNLGNLSRVAS